MTILVGYISSPQGEAALDRAVLEAQAHGHDLLVLNASSGEALVEERRLYDDQEQALRARLDESGVRYTIRRSVRPRHAADEILDMARDAGAESIVIGLRRRSPTGKLVFGSTAQRILLEADCPVLAVKAGRP